MPIPVKPPGENNSPPIENLNLDGDDAQSDGPYTHPSKLNNSHVDSWEVFINDTNRALSGALSRGGTIYTDVLVLFIRWADDDFLVPGRNNGIQDEIDSLEQVLKEAYGFKTKTYLIPSEDSYRSLLKEIFHLQDEHTRREELLVVYYGGHGEDNKKNQSVWLQGENGASVEWFSLQHILELAIPDVLILLDCCHAASADQQSVKGTVEVLAACGHETGTDGISKWSFTNRLTEVLRDMRDQSFTVAQLHSKLVNYRGEDGEKKLLHTPHHAIMSDKDKASILISALKRSTATDALDDVDLALAEESKPSDSVSPQVLIAVSVQGDPDSASWQNWLLSQRPASVKGLSLKAEGIWRSHSMLGIFSLPVAIWDLLPERSAYKFIGFVTTPNLVTQTTDSPGHSIGGHSIGDHADVDHTAPVQSQPVKPQIVGNVFDGVAPPVNPTLSDRILSSSHTDKVFRLLDHASIHSLQFEVKKTTTALYSEIKSSFEWHSDSSHLDDPVLNKCFLIEGKRLQLWAGSLDLDDVQLSGATLKSHKWSILKSSESILRNMLDLFHWVPGTPHPPSDSSGALESASESQANVKPTKTTLDRKIFLQVPVRVVVKQLSYFNDRLEDSCTLLEKTSLRYSLRTFCVRYKVSRLGVIQDAAALLGHRDIEQGAKARLVRRVEFDDNPAPSFHVIDIKDLQHQKRTFRTHRQTSLEIYKGQEILVDWYDLASNWYDLASKVRVTNLEVERSFDEPLAAILNQDLSALNLSVLRGVGCVKTNEGDTKDDSEHAFGCAFGAPDGKSKINGLGGLHHLIPPKSTFHQPDLGKRFKLANALVRTIFGMHLLDWFHGNLSTGNVVFCLQNEEVEHDLCHPYLLGFGLQEGYNSNRYKMIEILGEGEGDFEYYRHPEFRDFLEMSKTGRATFKPSYDIYSLGVVLWEIGTWETLKGKLEEPSYNYHGVSIIGLEQKNPHPMMTEEAIQNLRGQMGHRYTEAVVACLDGTFDGLWKLISPDNPQQLQDHLQRFQEKIVDPLAACSV